MMENDIEDIKRIVYAETIQETCDILDEIIQKAQQETAEKILVGIDISEVVYEISQRDTPDKNGEIYIDCEQIRIAIDFIKEKIKAQFLHSPQDERARTRKGDNTSHEVSIDASKSNSNKRDGSLADTSNSQSVQYTIQDSPKDVHYNEQSLTDGHKLTKALKALKQSGFKQENFQSKPLKAAVHVSPEGEDISEKEVKNGTA